MSREDSLGLLKRSASLLPPKTLIYLYAPYNVKGQGLYRNLYDHDDHLQIAKLLQSTRFPIKWVVSYDCVEQISDMYQLPKALTYGLNYTAQSRYEGSEIMFFSRTLKVPHSELPQLAQAA